MEKIFNTVLLLALPASGKSEVRKYLASIAPETLKKDFHIGENLQLDDYLYVHMMRQIDDQLISFGENPLFFASSDKPFLEKVSWGVLIELLNEDYEDLMAKRIIKTDKAAELLFKRYDAARVKLNHPPLFYKNGKPIIAEEKWNKILTNLEEECRQMLEEKHKGYPATFDGKTIIIEFARGGADGSTMPIEWGYQDCLKILHPGILANSSILYVWVTPEESRRKNRERAKPNASGSILHHGVPEEVMYKDYGCDDIDYLLETSGRPGFIKVDADGKAFYLPLAKFDNRVDKTSFIRDANWKENKDMVQAIRNGIKEATDKLIENYANALK